MADTVSSEPVVIPTVTPQNRPPRALQRRFVAAYLILATLLGGAAGLFVVYLGDSGASGSSSKWSTWRPTASGSEGLKQIATHVAGRYRLASGNQLVGVIAGKPQVQNIPITAIAIKGQSGAGTQNGIRIFTTKAGAMYTLCGLGNQCSILAGTGGLSQAAERGKLLLLESLELALYTFKYEGSDAFIALVPPPPPGLVPDSVRKKLLRRAVVLQPSDVKPLLDKPLGETLDPTGKISAGKLDLGESAIVARVGSGHFFTYEYQQIPDGTVVLVLTPLQA